MQSPIKFANHPELPERIPEDEANVTEGLVAELQKILDIKMPVEDASVLWDEADSPFQTVARLHAAPQPGWSQACADVVDETMRFSVWTGLAAHQPLGGINRVRRQTYEMSAKFREGFNRCPIHEPQSIALPDGR